MDAKDLPTQAPIAMPDARIDALLGNLLAAFGKKPKGPAKPTAQKLPRNAKPLVFHESFAELKTGYKVWQAQAKVIILEEQICSCCGSKVVTVKDELFLLDNKTSHSAWLRHEGYGIEAPETLPVRFHRLDQRYVSFCGVCASQAIDDVLTALATPQLSFPF
jgi:hypothetical protein